VSFRVLAPLPAPVSVELVDGARWARIRLAKFFKNTGAGVKIGRY